MWGVSSKISGEFDEERYIFLKEVCTNIVKLLQTDDGITGGDQAAKQMESIKSQPNRRLLKKAPSKALNSLRSRTTAGDTNKEMIDSKEHVQRILETLDVRSIIVEGLRIDFNIVFKGSRCSLNDKFKSQRWLIDSVEHILRLLLAFVRNNKENQKLLLPNLADLTKLCYAKVEFPAKPENWETDETLNPGKGLYPQVNKNSVDEIKRLAKLSIIELLRANPYTAARVPKSTFEMFAEFIDESTDATRTRDLDFFFRGSSARASHFDPTESRSDPWPAVPP